MTGMDFYEDRTFGMDLAIMRHAIAANATLARHDSYIVV
jgi:hypothetical protein